MELLVHINKRVKSRPKVLLPVTDLITQYADPNVEPFVTVIFLNLFSFLCSCTACLLTWEKPFYNKFCGSVLFFTAILIAAHQVKYKNNV